MLAPGEWASLCYRAKRSASRDTLVMRTAATVIPSLLTCLLHPRHDFRQDCVHGEWSGFAAGARSRRRPDVLASLERGLRLSGFDVATAVDGAEALRSATETRPDAIVLDINMPVLDRRQRGDRAAGDGPTTCRFACFRHGAPSTTGSQAWRRAPTITWSSPSCWPSWSRGSRRCCVGAVRRRRSRRRPSRSGPLEVDIPGRRARVNGADVDLTKREFDLLAVLAEHKTAVLSRAQLLELVWGYDFAADTNVVDVFIGYLRRKLEAGGAPRLLHTVRGVGFVLRTQ